MELLALLHGANYEKFVGLEYIHPLMFYGSNDIFKYTRETAELESTTEKHSVVLCNSS